MFQPRLFPLEPATAISSHGAFLLFGFPDAFSELIFIPLMLLLNTMFDGKRSLVKCVRRFNVFIFYSFCDSVKRLLRKIFETVACVLGVEYSTRAEFSIVLSQGKFLSIRLSLKSIFQPIGF